MNCVQVRWGRAGHDGLRRQDWAAPGLQRGPLRRGGAAAQGRGQRQPCQSPGELSCHTCKGR